MVQLDEDLTTRLRATPAFGCPNPSEPGHTCAPVGPWKPWGPATPWNPCDPTTPC